MQMAKMSSSRPRNRGAGANTSGSRQKGFDAKKAMVTPKGSRLSQGAQSGSGGAAKSRRVDMVEGPSTARATTPEMAANQGIKKGSHIMNGTEVRRSVALPPGPAINNAVPFGNDLATNVERGGPGVGRVLYGQCGTQGTYGKPVQGNPPAPGELFPGWPASKK
jgi:hypothetical protein